MKKEDEKVFEPNVDTLTKQIETQIGYMETLVNQNYKHWLREHDGHQNGFEEHLIELLPDVRFTFVGHEWKLIQHIG